MAGMQWINGRLEYVNEDVPGASTGVDPETQQPTVDAYNEGEFQHRTSQVESETQANQLASTELSEQQKAAKEQGDKEHKAKLAEAKLAKEQIVAEKAADDAGYTPPNQQQADYGLGVSREDVAGIEAPRAGDQLLAPNIQPTPEPQGEALYNQGAERVKESIAGETGANVAALEADADMNAIIGEKVTADLAEAQDIQDRYKKVEENRNDIDNQINAEIERDIPKPSPSALNLLGVFFGGLIAPMNGGRNVALETVQKQMEREVRVDVENKRKRMQGLQKRRGVATDTEAGIAKEAVAFDVLMAKKYKGMRLEMEARMKAPHVTAAMRANMGSLIGKVEMLQGDHQTKASERAFEMQLQMQAASDRRSAAIERQRGGRGRGGGSSKAVGGGVVMQAKNSPLYFDVATGNTVDYSKMDKSEQKNARDELAQVPLVDTNSGTVMRGIRGLSPTQAKLIQKAWGDRNKVKGGTERILELLSQVKDGDRLVIGGASKSAQGAQLQAEFTQLMVALKDQWELGAIQKPDERLLEGAMGANPTDAFAYMASKMNVNQIEAVMQNLQSGGNLRMNTAILSEAGLPSSFEIQMPRFDSKSDIVERATEQTAESMEKMQGNALAIVEELNSVNEAPAGIARPSEVGLDDLRTAVDNIVTSRKASSVGGPTSDLKKVGGAVALGNEEMMLQKLHDTAKTKEQKKIIKTALDQISKDGKRKKALAASQKKITEKKGRQRKKFTSGSQSGGGGRNY